MSAFRVIGSVFAASLFVLLFTLAPTASAGVILSVQPGSQLTVVAGNPAAVDLSISGLGAGTAPSVGTYDLTITFDPALLSFVNVNWGTGLDVFGLGDIRTFSPSVGTVNLFELSLDSASDLNALQSAQFLLASIQFAGLASGTSNITATINALGDADGANLPASVVYGPTMAVPEPSTGLLLASGLMCWASTRFRHQRAEGAPKGDIA